MSAVDQAEADSSEPDQDCPDEGRCTRRCANVCWHTIWCEPLSTYGDADDGHVHPGRPTHTGGSSWEGARNRCTVVTNDRNP